MLPIKICKNLQLYVHDELMHQSPQKTSSQTSANTVGTETTNFHETQRLPKAFFNATSHSITKYVDESPFQCVTISTLLQSS